MFVLGIDPGLSITGYGIIDVAGSSMRAVTAGVIRTSSDDSIADRLSELADDLDAVIEEFAPAEAAIEEVFVNRNLQTAMAVGRASGVAILAVARAGIPIAEYTPSAVKLAVTGTGDADKRQVQNIVARRLGLESSPGPADASDALGVAICHAQSSRLARMAAEGRR
jgi:crossover junction endodeoxyribonuclease RuvC